MNTNIYGLTNELVLLLTEFPNKPWDYELLSKNSNITLKYIKDNPDKPWSYEYLSMNPNITMKDVKENPDIEWNYRCLSDNEFKCDKYVRNRLLKQKLRFTEDDLSNCIEHIKYKPGSKGCIDAMDEFNNIILNS